MTTRSGQTYGLLHLPPKQINTGFDFLRGVQDAYSRAHKHEDGQDGDNDWSDTEQELDYGDDGTFDQEGPNVEKPSSSPSSLSRISPAASSSAQARSVPLSSSLAAPPPSVHDVPRLSPGSHIPASVDACAGTASAAPASAKRQRDSEESLVDSGARKKMRACDGLAPVALTRQQKENIRKAANKRRKREAQTALTWRPPQSVAIKFPYDNFTFTMSNADKFSRAKGSFVAIPVKEKDIPAKGEISATHPAVSKLKLVKWCPTKPETILDSAGRVIAALPGYPAHDDTWMSEVVPGIEKDMNFAMGQMDFEKTQCIPAPPGRSKRMNRRGTNHITATKGVSFGGGQQQPGNLKLRPQDEEPFDEFLKTNPMQRAMGWGSASMGAYFPWMYDDYRKMQEKLQEKHPHLRRPYEKSIFSAISVNAGGRVVTNAHRDNANLADGVCWIMAGGNYDHEKGGHLILWELGLMIEFPPGASVLIPSSVITHQNTTIGLDETRWSITMYCAGGLFRWVECGFMTLKTMRVKLPALAARMERERADKWKLTVTRYSLYEALPLDRAVVFRLSI